MPTDRSNQRKRTMKKYLGTYILLALFSTASAQIQEIPVNDENLKLAFDAVGFYEGTLFSLDTIEQVSSDSKIKCSLARIHFKSAFQDAGINLYQYLNDAIGKSQVEQVITSALEEYKKMFAGGEINLDLVDTYINDVEEYCKGKIQSPTKETLLYFKYVKSPSKEITDGYFEYFNTKGHLKSTGLEIKLKIPITYKMEEGQRPHVVQRFNEFEGHFGTKSTLTINEIPETEGKFDALTNPGLINETDMLEICLDDGAKLRSFEIIKIDGIPFAAVESTIKKTSAVGEIEMITLSYTTFFRNRVIILSFAAQVKSGSDDHFQKSKLLYKTIASSMIFIDQWK